MYPEMVTYSISLFLNEDKNGADTLYRAMNSTRKYMGYKGVVERANVSVRVMK